MAERNWSNREKGLRSGLCDEAVCFEHCLVIRFFLINDQKKLITFEKHFRKLHVNNSFVFGSEVSRLLLIHFSIRILKSKRLSCRSPLTALVRRLQGVQSKPRIFQRAPKTEAEKKKKKAYQNVV